MAIKANPCYTHTFFLTKDLHRRLSSETSTNWQYYHKIYRREWKTHASVLRALCPKLGGTINSNKNNEEDTEDAD